MIVYDNLWKTMKKRGLSCYRLTLDYGIPKSLLNLSLIHIYGLRGNKKGAFSFSRRFCFLFHLHCTSMIPRRFPIVFADSTDL